MKRLLVYLLIFLGLGLTFNINANNIENFQIEKMSIGGSLLDYFPKKFIDKKRTSIKIGNKKFKEYNKLYKEKNNKVYDRVVLYFNSNDPKYLIKNISGRKYFKNNISECYKNQKIIANEVEKLLKNPERIETGIIKQGRYPNGNSYHKDIFFYLNNGSMISIICYDYSKNDTRSKDRLSVRFVTKEFENWFLSKK
jgi:hypothetical protein